jgi:hypothetical protein
MYHPQLYYIRKLHYHQTAWWIFNLWDWIKIGLYATYVNQVILGSIQKKCQTCSLISKEMISIFPLWTFHLYVATFQQHLHMEYISPSWYDITENIYRLVLLSNPFSTFLNKIRLKTLLLNRSQYDLIHISSV